jgi:hypothetical protein
MYKMFHIRFPHICVLFINIEVHFIHAIEYEYRNRENCIIILLFIEIFIIFW